MKIRLLNVIFLLVSAHLVSAQPVAFRYKAKIEKAGSEGFYKILLQPSLLAECKKDLADLRIVDEHGHAVPYVTSFNLPPQTSSFLEFKQLEAGIDKDSMQFTIVENRTDRAVRSLWFRLRNSAVKRNVELTGSNDLRSWFALKEDILLQPSASNQEDSYWQQVILPSTTYRYYRALIKDKKKNLIDLMSIGVFADNDSPSKYVLLPPPVNSKVDSSNNITYLNLDFRRPYQIDKLTFSVDFPKYFRRRVKIFAYSGPDKQLLKECFISSKSREVFLTGKTAKLELEIENEDNPPLKLGRITAEQAEIYVLAYLERGREYSFLFGNDKAQHPQYDLNYFADSVLINPIRSEHLTVSPNPDFNLDKKVKKSTYAFLIWPAMGFAGFLLLLLTYKLMREIKSVELKGDQGKS